MIYGYARCSTNEKQQDIQRQVRELKQQGATDETVYLEYESGTKENRAELQKLLNAVQSGDTIIATEVSRITRSTKQLCEIIELAKEKRIKLILGTFVIDCSRELDPMTEGMLKMMGVFAELERNIISQRVKSGMDNAKAKGTKIGRPSVTADTIPAVFYKHYPMLKSGQINKAELARLCGVSYPTIYKYLSIVEGKKITVSVCSRKFAETLLRKGFPQGTAVISFYDPEDKHLSYGSKAANILYVPVDDFQTELLDAKRIANFVRKAKAQGLDILCQCESGRNRSAGCAAAILEYYYHNGQALFEGNEYAPDEMIYHAVLSALETQSRKERRS